MFALAFRRQAAVAVVAVVGLVLQNLANGGVDSEVALGSLELAVLCLVPAVFAWSSRAYRIAVAVISVVLTTAAIEAVAAGSPGLLPAALLSWVMLMPTRRPSAD